ncbi:MAG TPA: FAD-binding oxidoreductase [Thermomicrobiales bacterium]|nr:FAD-binding oxidoreductase [Thermomicrobiales bacterium]
MAQSADVVVIGGGISGTAAAYELASHGARVTLVERADLAGMASGWTLAGVRQSGRNPAELPLARAAVKRWQGLSEELGADVEYRQDGNLRLARTPEEIPVIRQMVEDQRALGLDLTFLPSNEVVRDVAPALAEMVLAASLCPTDGHANPVATVHAFAAAAKRKGATFLTGTEVMEILVEDGRVTGVQTSSGRVDAGIVVVAAGVYTDRLLAPLGIDLPLRIRHVSVVQTIPAPPMLRQVLGVANADFAGRQEVGGRFRLTGGGSPWQHSLEERGESDDVVQPPAQQVMATMARATEVVPALLDIPIGRVWGGLIDMTPDALPVIECPSEIDGLIVATGFSGHGFCLGPITGQIIRELALDGCSTLPIEPFRHDRFGAVVEQEAMTLHG